MTYCPNSAGTTGSGNERKRKAEELLPAILKEKRWTVEGAIRPFDANRFYYADPAEHTGNQVFLTNIKNRQLLMVMGARASGKSTRLYRLISQLAEDDYRCFMVSLEEVNVTRGEDTFWKRFGNSLQASHNDVKPIESSCDFLDAFALNVWKEQKIVVFIDEFDKLYEASNEIRNQVLETFRAIRNNNHLYAIHSIVTCGTFNIQYLNSINIRTSPFNIATPLINPYFTIQQTEHLFDEFARDKKIRIDPDIVDDIYTNSNGHPGMVCLCGRAIAENLLTEVDETEYLSYKDWQDFSIDRLDEEIYAYHTFRRMVDSLLNEQATDAINLLRSRFLGFLDDVSIIDEEKQKQADFLTAEGVLLKPVEGNRYHMASPLVDSFIRQYVIPKKYPSTPSTPIPKLYQGGPLDVQELLKMAVLLFDREHMKLAADNSYKRSNELYVGGNRNVKVARESVYDTELMRILKNLLNTANYKVTGQWHLRKRATATGSSRIFKDKHCDIIIKKSAEPTVVLELLATGNSTFIQDHINKALEYKTLIEAEEAWVVHFTCQDQYLQDPHWQSDDFLNQAINMIHFWHNQDFTAMTMSARWKDLDGEVQQVNNERVF